MNSFVFGLLGAAALIIAQSALAQSHSSANKNIWFSPELETELTTPGTFEGLYAGVSLGLSNQNLNAFFTPAGDRRPVLGGLLFGHFRLPAGVFVGYNRQLNPWLLAGVELQGEIAVDWSTAATDFRLLGLGRIGYLLSDDLALYQMAGIGLINGRSAYAIGMGIEQSFSRDFAVRAEAIAYGQLGAPVGVTDYGGFAIMKIAGGAVWRFGDYAEPNTSVIPPAGVLEITDFNGPYLGTYMGMVMNLQYNFFVGDTIYGWHPSRAAQGAIAGWNYAVGQNIRAGVEVQAGINYDTSGSSGWDAQVLARLGAIPVEGLLVYGSTGVGMLAGLAAYGVGGGVEYALWGKNTVRLDAQLLGEISPAPPNNASGFTATKVTVGTLWHLQ